MHLPQRWFVVATAFLFLVAANFLPTVSAREAALDLSFSVSSPKFTSIKSTMNFDPLAQYATSNGALREACKTLGETRVDLPSSTLQTCVQFSNLGFNHQAEQLWGYPIVKDLQLRTSVNNLLGDYYRNFSSMAEQDAYESKITSSFEYSAFVSALVKMDIKDFPGFADEISDTHSLKEAIAPWAAQIARHRNLPEDSFLTIGNGILISLAKSGDVTQARFTNLLAKSDVLNNYALSVDTAYQLASVFPSDAKNIERYSFIDSLVGKSEIGAKQAYLDMAIRNAIRIHPEMQTELESGLSVVQILNAKKAKSSAASLNTAKTKVLLTRRNK
jgi:hypothetical protein